MTDKQKEYYQQTGRRWSVFVYRGFFNPNGPIVVFAENASEAYNNALRDMETIHGITDCIDLVVEFEIVKPKRGLVAAFDKFGKLLRFAVNAIAK